MNTFEEFQSKIIALITSLFSLEPHQLDGVELHLNTGKDPQFGDLSCNAALMLAKDLGQNPRHIAEQIKKAIIDDSELRKIVDQVEIAGPGFCNLFIKQLAWRRFATELYEKKDKWFTLDDRAPKQTYLIEFVSANPTGPLHLGHGRGAIIGDVLGNILSFLGYQVTKEYLINDTGTQVTLLGVSLKARIMQELGKAAEIPKEGYHGEYLIDLAKQCLAQHGEAVLKQDDEFFADYAAKAMLKLIKQDLKEYGIIFDSWFSEKTLHADGSVERAIAILQEKKLCYEEDGALWFRSTLFGDDKDRVIRKKDGSYTYIAPDIAYHKNKFDRGFDKLIDIFGQDHHSYVTRLAATMKALGYDPGKLDFILNQTVAVKLGGEAVKMSKRAGTFTTLHDIVETVGKDVARFFFLNRKAEAHLDFDLEVALKKTEENPVFYIQYAYVRTGSILQKTRAEKTLASIATDTVSPEVFKEGIASIEHDEIELLKKIMALRDQLTSISTNYHTHLLSYYAFELAQQFHHYYAKHRVIDTANIPTSTSRLLMVHLVRRTLALCLTLLGLSKPVKM